MSAGHAPIRLAVDPANPGQFFACCGVLELAERLFGSAEGWFQQGAFHVNTNGGLFEILSALVESEPDEIGEAAVGVPVKRLIAPLRLCLGNGRGNSITLDSWMVVRLEKGEPVALANPPWNFWSGQQTSGRIWRDLRAAFALQLTKIAPEQLENLFFERALLSGRFGFDPGPAWNALDVGFSPNEQGIDVASSAAVELLAAVGVQRFRPNMHEDRQSFSYATWGKPLPPCVAAAAACGVVLVRPLALYRGRVISRGSYAALGRSALVHGDSHV